MGKFEEGLSIALELFETTEDEGTRSILKLAGELVGIEYGEEMGKFVTWAEAQI